MRKRSKCCFFVISIMKPFIKPNVVWGLAFAAFLAGCATRGDMESIQLDTSNSSREVLRMQRNLQDLNAEIKHLSLKIDAQAKKQNDIQQQISILSAETKTRFSYYGKKLESSSQPMRQSQEGMGARVDKLQLELKNLTRRFEESKYSAEMTYRETRNLRESYQAKIDDLGKRITGLNKAMDDIETKQARQAYKPLLIPEVEPEEQNSAPSRRESKASPPPPPAPAKKVTEKPEAGSGPEESLKNAYGLFTGGDIEGAKAGFQRVLRLYGKTKHAENAHYWLGECYFKEKKFDDAILEYEEVIKKYPKGKKVPDALLWQGLAFLEMKDAKNAKLILNEVIKRFPKSNQAAQARKKLNKI